MGFMMLNYVWLLNALVDPLLDVGNLIPSCRLKNLLTKYICFVKIASFFVIMSSDNCLGLWLKCLLFFKTYHCSQMEQSEVMLSVCVA